MSACSAFAANAPRPAPNTRAATIPRTGLRPSSAQQSTPSAAATAHAPVSAESVRSAMTNPAGTTTKKAPATEMPSPATRSPSPRSRPRCAI